MPIKAIDDAVSAISALRGARSPMLRTPVLAEMDFIAHQQAGNSLTTVRITGAANSQVFRQGIAALGGKRRPTLI